MKNFLVFCALNVYNEVEACNYIDGDISLFCIEKTFDL